MQEKKRTLKLSLLEVMYLEPKGAASTSLYLVLKNPWKS